MTDATERSLLASLAAHSKWAQIPDRGRALQPAREGFLKKFENQVDPERKLAPDVRQRLAENAKKAFYREMAIRSHRARRAKKAAAAEGEAVA